MVDNLDLMLPSDDISSYREAPETGFWVTAIMAWSAAFNPAVKLGYNERKEDCHGAIHVGYRFGQDDVSPGRDEPTRRGSVAEAILSSAALALYREPEGGTDRHGSMRGGRIFWVERCGSKGTRYG